MITLKHKFFLKSLSVITVLFSGVIIEYNAKAATRVANRGGGIPRNIVVTNNVPTDTVQPTPVVTEIQETISQEITPTTEEFIPEEHSTPALNKSGKFDKVLSSSTTSSLADNSFADLIKKQREAIATKEARDSEELSNKNALKIGTNQCDNGLRKCMQEKCGEKFTQCALDGATVFGDKINACKRNLKCTGEEIKLFSAEIMADRDFNVRTALYDSVVDCGKKYNRCMINECGSMFDKCLGKSASDAAIMACKKVADECREQDSGLSERVGVVLGKLRDYAEVDVKKDEERMYALRDLMRASCEKIGALFDERTFDCVYTISFFAGENAEYPMASRKRYAGDKFICTPEWFGIDVTTYKENAYRETRAQKGASSAMLGAGLGTGAAMVTSGAIQRGIDRQKAGTNLKDIKGKVKGEIREGLGDLKEGVGEISGMSDTISGSVSKAGDAGQKVADGFMTAMVSWKGDGNAIAAVAEKDKAKAELAAQEQKNQAQQKKTNDNATKRANKNVSE